MITVRPTKSPYVAKRKPILDSASELVQLAKEIRQMHEKAVKANEDANQLTQDTRIAIDRKLKEIDNLQQRVYLIQKGDKGEKGERGENGKDGTSISGKDGKDGKDGSNGKDGINPDPKEVVPHVIEHIKEEKPLKVEHIDGLKEALASYRNQLAVGGGMRGGQGSWKVSTLTGTIDGVNKSFTASSGNPPAQNSERVLLNYVEQVPTTDYTVSFANGTITIKYVTAPDASLSGFPHII